MFTARNVFSNNFVISAAPTAAYSLSAIDCIEPEIESPVAVKADTKPAKGEAKPEKTAGKLDCKKFFPSVGMTLSVRCE